MASFEHCPPEIVEVIAAQLERADVLSIRACSRALCSLASQDTFKSYYRKRKVYADTENLEDFLQFTKSEAVAPCLEEIEIVGIATRAYLADKSIKERARWIRAATGTLTYSSPQPLGWEETQKAQQELLSERFKSEYQREANFINASARLLGQAFSNLKRYGGLRMLFLDIVVLHKYVEQPPSKGGEWKVIWAAAQKTWKVVMTSLARSGLPVEGLDVFCRPARCSLSCRALHEIDWEEDGIRSSLKGLKSLSLSLSERTLFSGETGNEKRKTVQQFFADEDNFTGIKSLLGITSALEKLDLHWCTTRQYPRVLGNDQRHLFFEYVSELDPLPSLKSCRLHGVFVTETSLLRFLQDTQLDNLAMENVSMKHGSFAPIFAHCTSEHSSLNRLYLDDLHESRLVLFAESTIFKYPMEWCPEDEAHKDQKLERRGAEVRRPIRYGESPLCYRWRRSIQSNCGPP